MSSFKIIDFYNSGAQVVVKGFTSGGVDMTHTFGSTPAVAVPDKDIGYQPKPNSKLAKGASYDELEHEGNRHLLLKGGHVYAVKLGEATHVVSAEEGHLILPLPAEAVVEVDEYDEAVHGPQTPADEGDDEDLAGDDEDAADEEE